MIRMIGLFASLAVVFPAAAHAYEMRSDPKVLLQLENEANDACQGMASIKTVQAACDERDAYVTRLHQIGWCWGKKGQGEAEKKWHRCSKDSLRVSD